MMVKKMFKKIIFSMIGAAVAFSSVSPAFASQAKQQEVQTEAVTSETSESDMAKETMKDADKGLLEMSIIYEEDDMYKEGDSYTVSYDCNGKKGTLDIKDTSDNEGTMDIELDPGEYKVTDLVYNGSNSKVTKYAASASFTVEKGKTSYAMVLVGDELISYYLNENKVDPLFVPGIQQETQVDTETKDTEETSGNNAQTDETEIKQGSETREESEKQEPNEKKSFWNRPFVQLIPLAIIFGGIFIVVFILHNKGTF